MRRAGWAHAWRLRHHYLSPWTSRGARAGYPAHASPHRRGPNSAPDRTAISLGIQGCSSRRYRQRSAGNLAGAKRQNYGNQGSGLQRHAGPRSERESRARSAQGRAKEESMSVTAFLTDSTLCIGCKACEVACKEWNGISQDGIEWTGYSYDNTTAVGHSTWRHVKFVERLAEPGAGGNDQQYDASWTF